VRRLLPIVIPSVCLMAALATTLLPGCLDERPTGGLSEVRPGAHMPPPSDSGPQGEADTGPEQPPLDAGVDAAAPPDLGPGSDTGPQPEDGGPHPEDLSGPSQDLDLPPLPVEVDTVLSVEQVAAGETLRVSCRVLDEDGVEVDGVNTNFVVHPEVGWEAVEDDPTELMPHLVGEYHVTCQAPAVGLVDSEPAVLNVGPGPVDTVLTELDWDTIVAGGSAQATCSAYDAFGNIVPLAEPVLVSEPSGEGITITPPVGADDPFLVEATRAGFYLLSCPEEGARELLPAELRVDPGLPSLLAIGLHPHRRLYQIGEVVALNATVTDSYDNAVPGAIVARSSDPPLPAFGAERFRFDRDGHFRLQATVEGETEGNRPLSAAVEVDVSTHGPTLICVSPGDGSAVTHTPGQELNFTGQVGDPNGVRTVWVNGVEVAPGRGGRFTTPVATRYGINFVEMVAEDQQGQQSSSFCAFMVADRYSPMNEFLGDAVTLRLGQAAVDDNAPNAPLASLGDILRRMLNSRGLVDTVNTMMVGQNPLYDDCAVDCALFCCIDARITYRSGTFDLPGPNQLSLSLVNGGLRAWVRLPNPTFGFHSDNTGPNITGDVSTGHIEVAMTFDAELGAGGRPAVRLRAGSESVSVGELNYDGDWWNDWLGDIAIWLFGGYFQNEIAGVIRDQLRSNIDSVLDGVLGNLDISSLGAEFDVPSLTGGPPATLGVGINFSRINFNASRGLFGMGMRLTGPTRHAGEPNGAPIPPGNVSHDPGGRRAMAAAVSYGVINKALFTMWRAGYFHFDASAVVPGLDDAPDGTTLALAVSLPPVAMAGPRNGSVRIGLAGASMVLAYPGIFDVPVEIDVAAEASAGVRLVNGDELHFDAITVDRLLFATPTVALNPEVRAILQDLLTEIVQALLDTTINGALPVLPIPEFELPDMLSTYGIPRGTVLGLRAPLLGTTATHFVVEGNMGE